MTIALGADDAAVDLKNLIKSYLESQGIEVTDYGVHNSAPSLYPDIAAEVALAVSAHKHDRAILFCGTGLGMAITANKIPGIRAATCHDTYSAERARKSNDAQILTMGSRVIGPELAKSVVEAWLHSEFQGGGSAAKVDRIMEYEKQYLKSEDRADGKGGS